MLENQGPSPAQAADLGPVCAVSNADPDWASGIHREQRNYASLGDLSLSGQIVRSPEPQEEGHLSIFSTPRQEQPAPNTCDAEVC